MAEQLMLELGVHPLFGAESLSLRPSQSGCTACEASILHDVPDLKQSSDSAAYCQNGRSSQW